MGNRFGCKKSNTNDARRIIVPLTDGYFNNNNTNVAQTHNITTATRTTTIGNIRTTATTTTTKSKLPNSEYSNNEVKTTKYTIFTFLPKNLFEQFHRVANIYFLAICLLNFLPEISAFAKEIAPIPVIFVLCVTAVKDAYEDFRRYRADRIVNHSTCEVYFPDKNKFLKEEWKNLRPGHIVRISSNCAIPADVLLLSSSDRSGLCHVETANLDGENNLKQREVVKVLLSDNFQPSNFHYHIDVEAPNAEIYRFNGKLIVDRETQPFPLKKENLILRGCVLRNTNHVLGMIIYAGHETKVMLNNRQAPFKRSKLERQLNKDVIWCVIILIVLCLTGSIGGGIWLGTFSPISAPYLSVTRHAPALQSFINFWTFVIIFQAMIPLPLYVTLEIVKMVQVSFILNDLQLYDEENDKPVEVKAFNIPEDLGQVQYIFSDKTGTLTENKMEFRRCSIFGLDYTHRNERNSSTSVRSTDPILPNQQNESNLSPMGNQPISPLPLSSLQCLDDIRFVSTTNETDIHGRFAQEFILLLALCNTVVVSSNKNASGPVNHHYRRNKRLREDEQVGASRLRLPQITNPFNRLRFKGSALFELTRSSKQRASEKELSLHALNELATDGATLLQVDSAVNHHQHHHKKTSTSIINPSTSTVFTEEGDNVGNNNGSTTIPPTWSANSLNSVSFFVDKNQGNIQQDTSITSIGTAVTPESPSLPPISPQNVTRNRNELQSALSLASSRNSAFEILTPSTPLDDEKVVEEEGGGGGEEEDLTPSRNNNGYGNNNEDNNNLLNNYEAESPDEMALVKTAFSFNCRLLQRGPGFVTIWLPQLGEVTVEVLCILPFDSNRKRMSVIFRNPHNHDIVVYCKGADSTMLNILAPSIGDDLYKKALNSTKRHIHLYATLGLRTLVMAKRILTVVEYNEWQSRYTDALNNAESEEHILDLMCEVERNLTLIGASGIEDRLQDEVPETIAALRLAGINVWVLTGDKQETAINIANAASLITNKQKLLILNADSLENAHHMIKSYLTEINVAYPPEVEIRQRHHRPPVRDNLALCVDGDTLKYALDELIKFDFLRLAEQCCSVICCRSTPNQKAEVVKLVKENLRMQTLAIGDGANDVNMIRTADVGVGISGQEGMQAVMASDFAISRFKYLRRLLLVHGHSNYDKLSRIGLYIFYKCTVFILLMFWFQIFNGFSGQTMMDQLVLVAFNLTMTGLPPLIVGIFDKPLNQETLMKNPVLYREGQNCRSYLPWHFWLNIADAMWQSLVWFFVPYFMFVDSDIGLFVFGDITVTTAVISTLAHLGLETKSWTIIHWAAILLSVFIAWYTFDIVYNVICVICTQPEDVYWTIIVAMSDPKYWLCTLMSVILSLLPRIAVHAVKNSLYPSLIERARQLENIHGRGEVLPLDIPPTVFPVTPGTTDGLDLNSNRRDSYVQRPNIPYRSQSEKILTASMAADIRARLSRLNAPLHPELGDVTHSANATTPTTEATVTWHEPKRHQRSMSAGQPLRINDFLIRETTTTQFSPSPLIPGLGPSADLHLQQQTTEEMQLKQRQVFS